MPPPAPLLIRGPADLDDAPAVSAPPRADLSPARFRELAVFFAVGLAAGFVGGGIGCAIVIAAMRGAGL